MFHKSRTVLLVGVCFLISTMAIAQEAPQPHVFKLLRDDVLAKKDLDKEQAAANAWKPRLEGKNIELSFSLGMLDLNKTILEQDQVIYKYTDEASFWGNVNIKGSAAFNPVLRLGYSIKRWLTIEGIGGLSFADYTSTITDRHRRKNEQGAPVDSEEPVLGEFDTEARSLVTIQMGANAVVYPFSIRGDGRGRFHPYLTAGLGKIWYDMNSNYVVGSTGSSNLSFGGGFRLLTDRTLSLRVEAVMHRNTLLWSPVENFQSRNEGTLLVPLEEFPTNADGSFEEIPITSFKSQDMNVLNFSIGFEGSF